MNTSDKNPPFVPDEHSENECRCGAPGTEEAHSCPFASEINSDDTPICFCCKHCEHECAMDI